MLKRIILAVLAGAALVGSAEAQEAAFFNCPPGLAFNPYHPYHDTVVFMPAPQGPVPVHARLYSVPMVSPYYNVPPYIVLDP